MRNVVERIGRPSADARNGPANSGRSKGIGLGLGLCHDPGGLATMGEVDGYRIRGMDEIEAVGFREAELSNGDGKVILDDDPGATPVKAGV